MANINQISPDGGTTVYDIEDPTARSGVNSLTPRVGIAEGKITTLQEQMLSVQNSLDDLGTASTKNSTSVVTDSSDLVESGAVYQELANNDLIPNKNKLPVLLSVVKTLNTGGTWSGNTYTIGSLTLLFEEREGYVTKITVNGSSGNNTITIQLSNGWIPFVGGNYIVSGFGNENARTYINPDRTTGYYDNGNGQAFTVSTELTCRLQIEANNSFTNIIVQPMIRLATETDPTYEPYYVPLKDVVPTKVSYADNGVLGAKNFDISFDKTLNHAVYNKTATGYEVIMTSSDTYGQLNLWYDKLPKNTDMKLNTKVIYTSGVAKVVVLGTNDTWSNRQLIIESSAYTENTDIELLFNTGNYRYIVISLLASVNVTAQGDVTFNDYVIKLASDTSKNYVEPSKTNIQLTQDKADNSVIGTVEDGTTASQAYAVGSHAIRNGAFITWKNAKAQGETINDASDYTSGDVASELDTIDITSQCTFSTDCTWTIDWCKVIKKGNIIDMRLRLVTPTVVTPNKAILSLPDNITYFGATGSTSKYLGMANHDWNNSDVGMINISANGDIYFASDTWMPNTGCVFCTTFISNK